MLVFLIVAGAVLAAAAAYFIAWQIRAHNFRPTQDKQLQQDRLNRDLEPFGFAYEWRGDYFYSLMNCWQRDAGYCRLYDEGSPLFNMVMDCEPVGFYYAGKRWLIELWKGQYGITTGAEIGVYNTAKPDLNTDLVSGTFFESVSDAERLRISFVLRKEGAVILRRKALHWWLSAFRLGEFSKPVSLVMDAKIKFPNRAMCMAFTQSLINLGYRRGEFSVMRTTVRIHYAKPHSEQPFSQKDAQVVLAQRLNEENCKLYETITMKYPDTLDKLEYLKTAMPELYHFFLQSLYAKGFFSAFDIIRDALRQQKDDLTQRPDPPREGGACPCPR